MAVPQANTPLLRLLLTEDNAADADLELRELKRAGLRIAHRVADTEQGFVSALREFCPDVILSDLSMPGFDGMAVEVGGLRGARIGMLDPGTKDVIWKAWFGSWSEGSGPDALQASARDDESGSGLAGKALRELAPAISNDIASDSGVRQREKFVSFGIKAMAAFPLIVDGAAAGVLALQACEVGYFDQDEVNLLAELAANVSFALELMHKQERIT